MSEVKKKLRIKENSIVVLNRPDDSYFTEFDVSESLPDEPVNLIVLFVKSMDEFKTELFRIINSGKLAMEGRVFVAYPKRNNKRYDSYVHRDEIFPTLNVSEDTGFIEGTDFKFNQMVSLDETFTITGIKRTTAKRSTSASSQCVADYDHRIDEVRQIVRADEDALAFFDSLTPGYQRGWARYIFSAKREETQDKRKQETIQLLKENVKTK